MLEARHIDDRRAAAVFGAERQRRIVLALVAQERSLSELARLTQTPLNLLHHHVGRFRRLGLVELTRQEARAGAPIKYYRATARSFFVPAELMGAAPGAAMARRMRERLDRGLAASLQGVLYSHDDSGPRMRIVKAPGRGSLAAELWLELRLSQAEATALEAELRALLRRYQSLGSDRGHPYILHAALAPA